MAQSSDIDKVALANVQKLNDALRSTDGRFLDVSEVSSNPSNTRFSGAKLMKKGIDLSKSRSKRLVTFPANMQNGQRTPRQQVIVSSNLNGIREFVDSIKHAYQILDQEVKVNRTSFENRPPSIRWLLDPSNYAYLNEMITLADKYFEQQYPNAPATDEKRVKASGSNGQDAKTKKREGRAPRFDEDGNQIITDLQARQDAYAKAYLLINLADPNQPNKPGVWDLIFTPQAAARAEVARRSPKSRTLSSPMAPPLPLAAPLPTNRATPLSVAENAYQAQNVQASSSNVGAMANNQSRILTPPAQRLGSPRASPTRQATTPLASNQQSAGQMSASGRTSPQQPATVPVRTTPLGSPATVPDRTTPLVSPATVPARTTPLGSPALNRQPLTAQPFLPQGSPNRSALNQLNQSATSAGSSSQSAGSYGSSSQVPISYGTPALI
jgi:hypothetical protein